MLQLELPSNSYIFKNFKGQISSSSSPFLTSSLFSPSTHPTYNPMLFQSQQYQPSFYVDRLPRAAHYSFTGEEVRDTCVDNFPCIFAYSNTGSRELALAVRNMEMDFDQRIASGITNLTSCGPLDKAFHVIKSPLGNNYLDGVTVTFTCRADYYLHGHQERTCQDGLWSEGWPAWCRSRYLEDALKIFMGFTVSLLIAGFIMCCFCYCYYAHVAPKRREIEQRTKFERSLMTSHGEPAILRHANPVAKVSNVMQGAYDRNTLSIKHLTDEQFNRSYNPDTRSRVMTRY